MPKDDDKYWDKDLKVYNMKTEYGKGREDVINEMIHYCNTRITTIKSHTRSDVPEIANKRSGLINAYKDVIARLNIKMERMNKKINS